MSSPDSEDEHLPSSPPLQSAKRPADQYYAEMEDVDLKSESDEVHDAPSDAEPSLHSSQIEPNLFVDPEISAGDDLDNDSQDSTILPLRPNKFRGPPSTWRNRNAAERDLAASLDQLQAKDLSIHLYNSFKLKQRDRFREPGEQAENSEIPQGADEGTQWIPPKVWTAWPLPPGIVPREHVEPRWEEAALVHERCHSIPPRPGQQLKEMLVAQVLRKAKEQFHARQWESASRMVTATTAQVQQSRGQERNPNGTFSAERDHDAPGQKPVVMADDQRASEILQPTVQHTMTKLDDLLMGLHHARSAYLLIDDSGGESNGQSSERSTSRGRPRKRKRKAAKPDDGAEASPEAPKNRSSDSDDNPASSKKPVSKRRTQSAKSSSRRTAKSSSRRTRSQKFRDRKRRLGLRDWSDVVGIASMLGWGRNVVGSATARCATLFDEGIKFRTLEEGRQIPEEHQYSPNAPSLVFAENMQSGTSRAKNAKGNRFESAMVGGIHVDGFLKPIEGKKSWMYDNNKKSKRRQSSHKSSNRK